MSSFLFLWAEIEPAYLEFVSRKSKEGGITDSPKCFAMMYEFFHSQEALKYKIRVELECEKPNYNPFDYPVKVEPLNIFGMVEAPLTVTVLGSDLKCDCCDQPWTIAISARKFCTGCAYDYAN